MDPNPAILAPVSPPQVGADAPPRDPRLRVITQVQDARLDVAQDRLHGVVVGTALGQGHPAQLQLPHQPPRLPALARVGPVLVQHHPDDPPAVPAAHPPQEPADVRRPLAGEEGPPAAAPVGLVEHEQVELAPRLLAAGQRQASRAGVAPPAVGADGDDFDVEEQQGTAAGQSPPNSPEAPQDRGPLRVGAAQLPLDPPEVDPPFSRSRRRCSRLMALTRRCLSA
jgi:hypothetical protein